MEEKNELNDILLQTDEKDGKEKKILFAAIILLFVFFVVLGVMKFTNSESEETNETVKQELNQTDLNADAGFEQMALDENGTDANISQVLQKIKEGSNESEPAAVSPEPPVEQPAQAAPVTPPVTTQQPAVKPAVAPIVPKKEEVKKEGVATPPKAVAPKPVVSKPVATKPVVAPKVTPEVKTAPVKPVKKEQPLPEVKKVSTPLKVDDVKKVKEAPKAPVTTSTGAKAYLQVGNFTGKPKEELLSQIKANGYTYVVKEIVKDGVTTTKVLVGPFDPAKLNENIGKVRSTIKPDAFVVRD